MTLLKLFFLGVAALLGSSLCERTPAASFVGRLSIKGLLADDGPPNGTSSFDSAPNRAQPNWTSSSVDVPNAMLSKRVDTRNSYGPVLGAENCVRCPQQNILELSPAALLSTLSTQKMKTYMRGTPADLHNKCVFYTRAEDRPKPLSTVASDWACLNDKLSIWHLWPNKRMELENPEIHDFYGIYDVGNWLYPIYSQLPKPLYGASPATQYFQRMSEAMAQSCTGEVVIMTERPDTMKADYSTAVIPGEEFMNIWGDKERPALINSFRRQATGPFYVVDVRGYYSIEDSYTVYEYDVVTGLAKKPSKKVFTPGQINRLMARGDNLTNETETAGSPETHALHKRSCTWDSAVDSELQSATQYIDYFAGFYATDYP